MYRIMMNVSSKTVPENIRAFKFLLTENKDIFETDDLTELDAKVEELLLSYGKNDFEVVERIEYNVSADII